MRSRLLAAWSLSAMFALAACGDGTQVVGTPTPSEPTSPSASPSLTSSATSGVTCSASGLDGAASVEGVDAETALAASRILDAALQCDQDELVAIATEDQTRLTFGNSSPQEMFSLPENPQSDPMTYETLARLLSATPPAYLDEGAIWVWPSVAAGATGDADWDALVSSGLYSQQEADTLRAEGSGYLGWRLGISPDGTWLWFVAGD